MIVLEGLLHFQIIDYNSFTLQKVLKEGRKDKRSDLTTPIKVRAAARAMAAATMAAQVDIALFYQLLTLKYKLFPNFPPHDSIAAMLDKV